MINENKIPYIPLNIFQTWETKDLPPKMKDCVESLKKQNPEFIHHLYDANDRIEFIRNNFSSDVLKAYESLIPGAYKADLWRLCILYIYGGIYMDIKCNCINNFKLIELTDDNHLVEDMSYIYNAFIVCEKGHPFLLLAIKKIVANVKTKYYGRCQLCPTGPIMLSKIFYKNKINIKKDLERGNNETINYNHKPIISTDYCGYRTEQNDLYIKNKLAHYDLLWHKRKIYI